MIRGAASVRTSSASAVILCCGRMARPLRLSRRAAVAPYLGRHGESRGAKAVLISAVPPLMVKTAANPGGLGGAKAHYDGIVGWATDERTGEAAPHLLYLNHVL